MKKAKNLVFLILALLTIKTAIGLGNSAPSVGTLTAPSSITLNAGTTKLITCNATLTDTNGYSDIESANATFFDTAQTTETSADDNNNHYTNSSCTLSGGTGNTINASCAFTLQYYANNASSWQCKITTTDGQDTGSNTKNITVNELKTISVTALGFANSTGGTLDLGGTSSQVTMNITNTGNVNASIQVNSTSFNCSIGTLQPSTIKYSNTSGFSYSNGTALTSTPTATNITVAARTNDSVSSVNFIYWLLQMPSQEVGGNCNGTVTTTAS